MSPWCLLGVRKEWPWVSTNPVPTHQLHTEYNNRQINSGSNHYHLITLHFHLFVFIYLSYLIYLTLDCCCYVPAKEPNLYILLLCSCIIRCNKSNSDSDTYCTFSAMTLFDSVVQNVFFCSSPASICQNQWKQMRLISSVKRSR